VLLSALVWLDPDWVRQNRSRILPQDEELADLREAVWDSYLAFNHLYLDTADILGEEYMFAARRLTDVRELDADAIHGPLGHLVEHIVSLYVWGVIGEDSPLLTGLYRCPSGAIRGHAAAHLGRAYDDPAEPPQDHLERILALWGMRLDQLTASLDDEAIRELRAFGWVFQIAALDADRSLALLIRTLELTSGTTDWDHGVVGRLAKVCTDYPEEAVHALDLMARREGEVWTLFDIKREGEPILRTAMTCGVPVAREVAIRCINTLGRKGIDVFRPLLEL